MQLQTKKIKPKKVFFILVVFKLNRLFLLRRNDTKKTYQNNDRFYFYQIVLLTIDNFLLMGNTFLVNGFENFQDKLFTQAFLFAI